MAIQKLMMAFVTLIIGIVLLGVVSIESADVTSKDIAQNETVDLVNYKNLANVSQINTTYVIPLDNAYATTDWQSDDGGCDFVVNLFALANATPVVDGTDYNITSDGGLSLFDSAMWHTETMSNSTYITYTYCEDEYMTLSWGRSVMVLIPGFFAIALLMVSLALFYSIARETGVI